MGALQRLVRALGRVSERRRMLRDIKRLGPWFYSFKLREGLETPLMLDWLALAHETRFTMILPELDGLFSGRWSEITCLDVGCNEGYFGFKIAERGAKAVVGFDAREVNIAKAKFVKQHLGTENISFHVADVTALTPECYGVFDITLFLGLLYHLENPIDVLRRLRAVTTQLCVIDTQLLKPGPPVSAVWGPKVEDTHDVIGLLEEPKSGRSPLASTRAISLVPNRSALFKMLRHVGFKEIKQLEPYEGCFDQYATSDRVIVLAQ